MDAVKAPFAFLAHFLSVFQIREIFGNGQGICIENDGFWDFLSA
jgi:hypothetical protein